MAKKKKTTQEKAFAVRLLEEILVEFPMAVGMRAMIADRFAKKLEGDESPKD